ncbi:hypothetical protein ACPV5V_23835, partial [Vibrio campbellii]
LDLDEKSPTGAALTEDSVDLLDELMDSSDDDFDLSDSEQMLDELLTDDDEQPSVESSDDLSDGTELFDELLEIEQSSLSSEQDNADLSVDPDDLLAEFGLDNDIPEQTPAQDELNSSLDESFDLDTLMPEPEPEPEPEP